MLTNINIVSVVGWLASGLISSGALLFFFRYGIRLALVEENLRQNNLPSMAAKLVVIETKIAKLDKLDGVETKVEMILKYLHDHDRDRERSTTTNNFNTTQPSPLP